MVLDAIWRTYYLNNCSQSVAVAFLPLGKSYKEEQHRDPKRLRQKNSWHGHLVKCLLANSDPPISCL